jgi:hypothetical protein
MKDDDLKHIIPHIPIYHSKPNKFLRYEERPFQCITCIRTIDGIERVAIFLDKNGKQQEMTAQIIWINL